MNPPAMVVTSRSVTFGNDKPPALKNPRGHLIGSSRKARSSGSSDKDRMSSTSLVVSKWIHKAHKFLQRADKARRQGRSLSTGAQSRVVTGFPRSTPTTQTHGLSTEIVLQHPADLSRKVPLAPRISHPQWVRPNQKLLFKRCRRSTLNQGHFLTSLAAFARSTITRCVTVLAYTHLFPRYV